MKGFSAIGRALHELLFGKEPEPEAEFRTTMHFLHFREAVCHRCNGKGSIVNPNVDGHGITAEEFHEDPDFREDYFSGVYDVDCPKCEGRGVILVIDERRSPRESVRFAEKWMQEYYEDERTAANERRAEMGFY